MQWHVLLEAERGSDVQGVDVANLRRLLVALAHPVPGALHSAERYALQLEVDAPGASEAVRAAIHRWEDGLREMGLPRWELVRVEALTRDEFEKEFLTVDWVVDKTTWPSAVTLEAGEQRGVEEILLRHAFHDPLTDLASQSLFRDYLEHTIARPRAADDRCALLLLDVDRFAELNERIGARTADEVLVVVAQRLASAAGRPHKVGRMGGDQFAVFLQAVSSEDASSTARRIVDTVAAPIVLRDAAVNVTVSVGVAMEDPGDTGEDLLGRASLALRTAQDRGGKACATFSPEMADADVRRLRAEREAMTAPDTNSYLALLERLSLAVAECDTLEDAGLAVLRHVCDHAGFPVGRFYRMDTQAEGDPLPTGVWMVGGSERLGSFADVARTHPLRRREGVAGRALASGAAVSVRDIACEPGLTMPYETVAAGMRGAVGVPVLVGNDTVAVLEFFAEQALESCDGLLQLLTTIAAQLGAVSRRASAETARARAEVRLRVLLESSGVHVKILGPDGRLREQYPVTWAEDSSITLSAVDYIHPDDLAVAVRGWADALESPGPHGPFECRVRMPDGSWRWAEVTTNNMLAEPAVAGIVTYGLDVEDRKRPEEALRQCESRLRDLEAFGRIGTWRVDLGTLRVEWSDEMYRILGLEPGEVEADIGTLLELTHPHDRAGMEEQRRRLAAGAAQAYTFRAIAPDGTLRWIEGHGSAVCDRAGRVVAIQGTARDVTGRRQLEQAVRDAERRLREVEALAVAGSWRTDTATGVTTWSAELYDILGLDRRRVVPDADTFMAAVHPEDRARTDVRALCQRRLAAATDFECRIVRPGGEVRWVRVRSSPTEDGTGAPTGYRGVVVAATTRARDDRTVPA